MKHNKKTLLLIAGVAIMLAGVTSAYAYYEPWDGWINSGELTYGGNTYNYVSGGGGVTDSTHGDVDDFFLDAIAVITFWCSGNNGTIVVSVTSSSGTKPTGQSGQKEGSGNWVGSAVLTRPGLSPISFTILGTWDTGDEYDDMYFDYVDYPDEATYSAEWEVSSSIPPGLDGDGGSSGKLLE